MRLITHLVFGILIALVFDTMISFESLPHKLLFYSVVAFSAILPDMDYSKHRIALVHRGILHSLWSGLFLGLVAYLVNPFLVLPALLGTFMHLLLDSMTPEGVKLFYPFLRVKGKLRTGSAAEYAFLLAGVFLSVALTIYSF